MTEFYDCDDYTPYDAIEAKIYEKLWEINAEVAKLHSLVESFTKLGIPVSERRALEWEIRMVFGERGTFCIHDICDASRAAKVAAKSATR